MSDSRLAWVKTVKPVQASGLLPRLYAAAVQRAGKVFQIIEIQSLRPRVVRASTQLHVETMCWEESGLSRAQREMITITVSRVNDCFY